jgi:hypothetical protein
VLPVDLRVRGDHVDGHRMDSRHRALTDDETDEVLALWPDRQ